MTLTAKHLEEFQAQYPDYRMELVNGEIIVSSPLGYQAAEVAVEIAIQLGNWIKSRKLGRVTGSNAGFLLNNSNIRAPSAAFVQAWRLRRSPQSFAELAPDLTIEVKSPTDSITKLRDKIDEFLELGTRVGILINPEKEWVEIRRSGQAPIVLQNGDIITVPDLLPGWEVKVEDLWSPQFD
ncbi:Uma2 family endonuclease [Leptolyngbya sp. AN03gr2]|uniref:Uma2 family endonuclease n=1 Tax=unclassified Leptolyngbya TaxID=2650499 RepID=UPI003D322042